MIRMSSQFTNDMPFHLINTPFDEHTPYDIIVEFYQISIKNAKIAKRIACDSIDDFDYFNACRYISKLSAHFDAYLTTQMSQEELDEWVNQDPLIVGTVRCLSFYPMGYQRYKV